MSTNIHIRATREVVVVKTGRTDAQEISFPVWQTPTAVTMMIKASADPLEAYKNWILKECSQDEEFPVYADDDIFGEGEPVGKEIYNAGKEHVEQFEQWLEMCREEGYTVVVEAW